MKSGPSTAADLKFPDFTLVTASAGSGKTHALTYRFLRFILSDRIPGNNLQNILAITFTNNAAREMKQRILGELKSASLGEEDVLEHLAAVGVDRADAKRKAGTMVDYLLDHYSEFQVQTIDSFLSRVFRASALEFGYPPGVEILIDSAGLLRQTFDEFARELAVDTAKRATLDRLVDMLLAGQADNSRYLWNPFEKISGEVRSLYNTLSQFAGDIASPSDLSRRRDELRVAILSTFEELRRLVAASRMEVNRYFDAVVDAAERKDIEDLIGRKSLYNPLLKKTGANAADVARWQAQFDPIQARMKKLADEFTVVSARTYYNAYAEALRYFRSVASRISKEEGEITIADVNRLLAGMVKQDIVPEIYFYLGERINHYLIDEFQDTSPLQWSVFRPLAEESLSKKGSLFIVGDPKQSIYTFRGADWQIMRRLETGAEKFPSAPVRVEKLKTNFRSFERIVSFNKEVFHTVVPLSDKKEAGRLSGLSDYEQHVKQEFKGKGHVEVIPIQDDPGRTVRRSKVIEILKDCTARGYSLNDVTVLTPRNDDVVVMSEWLNHESIPFISHSNLDIRGRKVTGELLAILRFLDSPVDDLALTTFILGHIFSVTLTRTPDPVSQEALHAFLFDDRRKSAQPGSLYRKFRERFPELWREFFEDLFNRVGYLPLYDLVSEVYKAFDLFALLPEEEASMVKFLEVIKDFEDQGQNSLKDFLAFAGEQDEDASWNIPVPQHTDAVSVMTIHKAKGLGNRVVIVLLEDSIPRPENLFIREDEDGLHLLRINADSAEIDPEFQQLYVERHLRRAVDDLNKLYVAFTRAKEELYVISVSSKRGDEPSTFLPVTGYGSKPRPQVVRQEPRAEKTIRAGHEAGRAALLPVTAEPIGLYERKRGEFIHAVLARIEFLDKDVGAQIHKVALEAQAEMREHADTTAVERLLVECLKNSAIREFFVATGGRKILNEQEFARPDGRLFRMDRIVVDRHVVTVVDFKTGAENPEYHEQVEGYLRILGEFYKGRTVHGALAYVDRGVVREVTVSR